MLELQFLVNKSTARKVTEPQSLGIHVLKFCLKVIYKQAGGSGRLESLRCPNLQLILPVLNTCS